MGFYVHFHICFNADYSRDMAQAAQDILDMLWDKEGEEHACEREAVWLLKAIQDLKNYNTGPKGSLFTWGIVGNYTRADDVIDDLKEFFLELLTNRKLDPYVSEHIIAFEEKEQSEKAIAYEIYLKFPSYEAKGNELIVKRHEMPFCWFQM